MHTTYRISQPTDEGKPPPEKGCSTAENGHPATPANDSIHKGLKLPEHASATARQINEDETEHEIL